MALACRLIIWGFAAAYVIALFLFLVGTFGWFGSETGPLAGVFLMPLGLPWNQLLGSAPEPLRPFLAAAAPLLNLAILKAICLRLHGSGAG
jgi:hypothetical protein